MISGDLGQTWTYGGLLTKPDMNIGYVNGYFKYCGNRTDRIDFICTEHHPRDYNTSIYHGYIKGGKTYKSDGNEVDSNVFDKTAPYPSQFTPVFKSDTVVNGMTMTRCWNNDVQLYEDGSIATLIKARANDNELDHRFFYCRYDGSKWNTTYLCKAGPKLYSSEQDYTGLGALVPDNPNVIYISTTFDPRDDETDLRVHEIFKGVTTDKGATWTWTPITQNSSRDNLRPIVPAWNKENTALLWLRGTYYSSQNFDFAVVGILQSQNETISKMSFVDATLSNTTAVDGSALAAATESLDNTESADNKWHIQQGLGNGGSVFVSGRQQAEDAPALKTEVKISEAGTYDVWVNFWANPAMDWRIKAGFSADQMPLFRQMACKQVNSGDYSDKIVLSPDNNASLYQAYLGRIEISDGESFSVYIDDETAPVRNLSGRGRRSGFRTQAQAGNECTLYDGISYARVKK